MTMKHRDRFMLVWFSLMLTGSAVAGSLEAPAQPSDPASAMHTLEDLHNRLNSGTMGSKRTGGMVMPSTGPTAQGKTTSEIMAIAPTVAGTKWAKPGDVACGKTFWNLSASTWGLQTGTKGCPPPANNQGTNSYSSPTNIQITNAVNGEATLSWTAVSGATSYNLYYATQSGVNKNNHTCMPGGATKTNITSPYTLTGLTNGTTYYLVVSAVSAGGEGMASAVTAAPVARERFTANGNGTVTDGETGLVLLQNANCFGMKTWDNAMDLVAILAGDGTCGLNDGSMPGDWRLPTYPSQTGTLDGELAVLYAAKNGSAFSGVQSDHYWSSTARADSTGFPWYIFFGNGSVYSDGKTNTGYIWPVRSGQ
ncbi:MAG: DUF1566 domain-containing protein [Magnetococcales bacterium]|nr:DUF1566 domain-containing protein [Magnetococcales bacterium]